MSNLTQEDMNKIRDAVISATYSEFAGKYDNDTIVNTDWTKIQFAIADACIKLLSVAPTPHHSAKK